jgi:probable rRNA maturation factor
MMHPRRASNHPRRVGGDGELEVFCADEQSEVPIDLARWQKLALDVLASEGVRGAAEMTLVFVDEPTMTELNTQYMGSAKPTDVLAFPLDAVEASRTPGPGARSKSPDKELTDFGDLPLLLGDVVVCPAVAVRQAPIHAGSLEDELALLLVHGILHVLGADHDTPEAEHAMHARERRLLESLHWGHEAPADFRHKPETES